MVCIVTALLQRLIVSDLRRLQAEQVDAISVIMYFEGLRQLQSERSLLLHRNDVAKITRKQSDTITLIR